MKLNSVTLSVLEHCQNPLNVGGMSYYVIADMCRSVLMSYAEEHEKPSMTTDDLDLPLIICAKCGGQAVAFNCDVKGCPVNGGACYG